MSNLVSINTYVQPGYVPFPSIRLTDKAYGDMLDCVVPCCADIMPVNLEKKVIYLAYRINPPADNQWWPIGGRMRSDEKYEEAALRNFRRETGIILQLDRIREIAFNHYFFNNRSQDPQHSCQTAAHVFIAELSLDEIKFASANLDPTEYRRFTGLAKFNREELVIHNILPPIIQMYDIIFPQE